MWWWGGHLNDNDQPQNDYNRRLSELTFYTNQNWKKRLLFLVCALLAVDNLFFFLIALYLLVKCQLDEPSTPSTPSPSYVVSVSTPSSSSSSSCWKVIKPMSSAFFFFFLCENTHKLHFISLSFNVSKCNKKRSTGKGGVNKNEILCVCLCIKAAQWSNAQKSQMRKKKGNRKNSKEEEEEEEEGGGGGGRQLHMGFIVTTQENVVFRFLALQRTLRKKRLLCSFFFLSFFFSSFFRHLLPHLLHRVLCLENVFVPLVCVCVGLLFPIESQQQQQQNSVQWLNVSNHYCIYIRGRGRGREEKKERKRRRRDVPAASAGIGGREGERERPDDRPSCQDINYIDSPLTKVQRGYTTGAAAAAAI